MSDEFKCVGGDLSLDFHNTASWSGSGPGGIGVERLKTYADLLDWGRTAGAVSDQESVDLARRARAHAGVATRSLNRARQLRRVLHRIYTAVAEDTMPDSQTMDELNRFLARVPLEVRASQPGRFEWHVRSEGSDDLNRPLWPVVWSAVTLLAEAEMPSVKACASGDCGWLFVDDSRRGNRRWCDMGDCGNREKARRYYHRHRPRG